MVNFVFIKLIKSWEGSGERDKGSKFTRNPTAEESETFKKTQKHMSADGNEKVSSWVFVFADRCYFPFIAKTRLARTHENALSCWMVAND